MNNQITRPDIFTKTSPIFGNQINFFQYSKNSWDLYIASHATLNSNNFSWGGFRILRSEDRGKVDPILDAIGLADGMEQKKSWINITGIGTPIWKKYQDKVFGGKVVLQPSADAEVGQPHDLELLEFAANCFIDFEKRSGITLITGQDLGHGKTSQGIESLDYVKQFYDGIGQVNTSIPTAEGNFHFLDGMFKGAGKSLKGAKIGLFGCGSIGQHLLTRLLNAGSEVEVLEPREHVRKQVEHRLGKTVYSPSDKQAFFALTGIEAVAANALRGTFDQETVSTILANISLKFVTGCENNSMLATNGPQQLSLAGKLYCPYALCGMNGGHAAVGNRLIQHERQLGLTTAEFNLDDYNRAAVPLSEIAQKATEFVLAAQKTVAFDEAVKVICS